MAETERKGLRFEVYSYLEYDQYLNDDVELWDWVLIGADGPVCRGLGRYGSEAEARSAIAASKGRMKAARFAKVMTVDGD